MLTSAILIIGVGVAAAIDLRTRRVPNALSATLALAGLALAATGAGRIGLGAALMGAALGLVIMLPAHFWGGMGAGDVKLFAAAGTLIGPAAVIPAWLATAIAGGLLAIAVAVRRGRLQETCAATVKVAATAGRYAGEIARPDRHNRFAYAPAIAAGVLVANWVAWY